MSDSGLGNGLGREVAAVWPRSRGWLLAEFLVLFVAIPLAIAVALPPRQMFPALFGFTLVGLVLMWRTPGFDWRGLWRGRVDWPLVAGFAAVTLLASVAFVGLLRPGALFQLPRQRPEMWAMILLLYPFLSALPQELIFRALFFRRYGAILPAPHLAIPLNAALFSLAHLMYWHWIVAGMTFAGGIAFAWAYETRRSFPLAFMLHAVAGGALFTAGMGVWFYSGNVVRPF